MGLIHWFKETVDGVVAASQGVEAGETWIELGGGPVSDEDLHRLHVMQGLETPDWRAFNKGFKSVAGSKEDGDE